MSDLGFDYTEEEIKRIEKELNKLYSQAAKDLKSKLDLFTDKYETKEQIHLQELKDGKITQDDFDAWKRGQVFQGEQWEAKRQQVLYTMTQTNKMASEIVNNEAIDVFTMNGNYVAYNLEKTGGVNFGFSLYDTSSVAEIVKQEDPTLLPKWKVNEPKDYIWNSKKVGNQITQGIIQGEKLNEIANRLVKNLCMQNENSSLTFARTAMTGAQNGGRTLRFRQAEELGIKLHQEWMATLDGRTRSSHRHMDGEKIPIGKDEKFSNKCRYPGDPEGPPWEVYNCRCTLVADLDDYPAEQFQRYDNINGKPIQYVTYDEWVKSKKGTIKVDTFQSLLGKAKSVPEVNVLMNSQDWWREHSQTNLNGCDLDSAKSIAASYEQVFVKYPQLKGKFNGPDANPIGMKENTYAWCYRKGLNGKIQVNPNKYNNWSELQRSYEDDVISGFHPKGTTAEAIITHEIGHAIDGLLAKEGIKGGITASGQYTFPSSTMRNTIMNRAAKQDETVAKYWNAKDWNGKTDKFWQSYAVEHYVSQYASRKPSEWFAECFAEYITSANPRLVAKMFGEELEKLLEKLT